MLSWETKQVKIAHLKEYPNNPRRISKNDYDLLVRSIKEDGYHKRLLVDKNLQIIGGHQRRKALLEAGLKKDDWIEVLVPNRELTQEEFDRINVRDNLDFGEFDFNILSSNFDADTLIDFGLPENVLLGKIEEEIAQNAQEEEEFSGNNGKCKCRCEVCQSCQR